MTKECEVKLLNVDLNQIYLKISDILGIDSDFFTEEQVNNLYKIKDDPREDYYIRIRQLKKYRDGFSSIHKKNILTFKEKKNKDDKYYDEYELDISNNKREEIESMLLNINPNLEKVESIKKLRQTIIYKAFAGGLEDISEDIKIEFDTWDKSYYPDTYIEVEAQNPEDLDIFLTYLLGENYNDFYADEISYDSISNIHNDLINRTTNLVETYNHNHFLKTLNLNDFKMIGNDFEIEETKNSTIDKKIYNYIINHPLYKKPLSYPSFLDDDVLKIIKEIFEIDSWIDEDTSLMAIKLKTYLDKENKRDKIGIKAFVSQQDIDELGEEIAIKKCITILYSQLYKSFNEILRLRKRKDKIITFLGYEIDTTGLETCSYNLLNMIENLVNKEKINSIDFVSSLSYNSAYPPIDKKIDNKIFTIIDSKNTKMIRKNGDLITFSDNAKIVFGVLDSDHSFDELYGNIGSSVALDINNNKLYIIEPN